MVDTNYYCDKCGKFIVNKKDRINGDLYADEAIYIGDPVGEIEYNLLIKPFKKEDHPYYNRRLEGTKILCMDCSLKIALFLGLLKGDEYDKEALNSNE